MVKIEVITWVLMIIVSNGASLSSSTLQGFGSYESCYQTSQDMERWATQAQYRWFDTECFSVTHQTEQGS